MPNVLQDLVINRVDLVDEGANSAAFVELFKRKETNGQMNTKEILSKMKPEHAAVLQQDFDSINDELAKARESQADVEAQLSTANEELAKAKEDLATAEEELAKAKAENDVLKAKECSCDGEADDKGVCKACGKVKKGLGFDETEVLKSMPESARAAFIKMREQKEAAEEQVRKAAEDKAHEEAVAKAASMKALPIEQEELVGIIKSCPASVVDLLKSANDAIEAAVLDEVGKGKPSASTDADAWNKIEAKADEIAKRDSVTKQKAIATAIKENPDLYREYLNGGAK